MAEQELQTICLRDDFYRDGFYKALSALAMLLLAIILLLGTSIYLVASKPAPVVFGTATDFRLLPDVPINKSYLAQADLIQWVSDALPAAFTLDFVNYPAQLQRAQRYFTANGWKKFLQQLKIYADAQTLLNSKLFVTASAGGAPFVTNQGLLQGDYAWWIQMPLNLSYSSASKDYTQPLKLQVLVVRVPTLDNLSGVAIDNLIVATGEGSQGRANE